MLTTRGTTSSSFCNELGIYTRIIDTRITTMLHFHCLWWLWRLWSIEHAYTTRPRRDLLCQNTSGGFLQQIVLHLELVVRLSQLSIDLFFSCQFSIATTWSTRRVQLQVVDCLSYGTTIRTTLHLLWATIKRVLFSFPFFPFFLVSCSFVRSFVGSFCSFFIR